MHGGLYGLRKLLYTTARFTINCLSHSSSRRSDSYIFVENRDFFIHEYSFLTAHNTKRLFSGLFHTPPAFDATGNFNSCEYAINRGIQSVTEMLPSLGKGGEGIAHSFNCPPCMAGLCLGDVLVDLPASYVYT